MMPVEDSSLDTAKDTSLFLLGLEEMVPYNCNAEQQSSLLSIFGSNTAPNDYKTVLHLNSIDKDRNLEQCTKLNNCDDTLDVESDINLIIEDKFSINKLHQVSPAQYISSKKSLSELKSSSIKELELLLEDLQHVVKKISSELVQLLLENDALQQESDARNVAIEQLLKITVKNAECEPRQIQMSVILPDEEDNDST